MFARRDFPKSFEDWNRLHHSPFGRSIPLNKQLKLCLPRPWYWKLRGPFSIQPNNDTRRFEYPWAYAQADLKKGTKVVEIGGGLSGFQFVLARNGCDVTNIDPGMEAKGKGWPCDHESMDKLNRMFGTNVHLCNDTIASVDLEPDSIDYFYSISVIEHLPWSDVQEVMQGAWKYLKPGGEFILTVDLFPDVVPFKMRETNKYGGNINIREMVECCPFELIEGERSELYGYEEFDVSSIAKQLASEDHDYLVGERYPSMIQCLKLKKP